jgi:Spy/CpxP family protein refolding chaperone
VKFPLGPRVQAVLVLALVGTIGALLGILGDRVIAQRSAALPGEVPRMSQPRGGMIPAMRYSDRLADRLNLTADQRVRIDSILAEERIRARELAQEFQPQFRSLAEQTRMRVESVLTAEQREQMRAMRQQRARRMGDPRPPPGSPARLPRQP